MIRTAPFLSLLLFVVAGSTPLSLAQLEETNAPAPTPAPTLAPKAPSDESVSKSEIGSMAIQPPPSDSPLFIERQEARDAMAKLGREGFGMFVPKPPRPPAQEQIATFFKQLFHRGKKGGKAGAPAPLTLMVEPSDFSLGQTSEIDVSLRITNSSRHEMEFLFPDNQRLEILVKDAAGGVVSRWSQDRAFDRRLGFTEINPSEFVVFAERLGTSGMKAGQTYTIEASLANQRNDTVTSTITPKP